MALSPVLSRIVLHLSICTLYFDLDILPKCIVVNTKLVLVIMIEVHNDISWRKPIYVVIYEIY